MDLVTGADGFIGSHLVEALVKVGRTVRGFVQYNARNHWGWLEVLSSEVMNNVEVVAGDLRDATFVRNAVSGCERAFHLGALIAIPYSYQAPSEYLNTNVGGTLNVMQAARQEDLSLVVHTSTSEVYGTARYLPIDEEHPLQAQSPYSASKIAADKVAESFWLSFGVPLVTVRPFNTFGPRQSARAIIPTILTQAIQEPFIRLGSIDPIRDFTYVDDTVNAFMLAGETPAALGQLVNVGQGRGVSVQELTSTILALLEMDKEVVLDPQRVRPPKSEVMELICDNRKAEAMLGWKPRVSLADGLSRTLEWFRVHGSAYKSHIYNI